MKATANTKALTEALARLSSLPGVDSKNMGASVMLIDADEFGGIQLCRTTINALAKVTCEGEVEESGKSVIPYLPLFRAMETLDGKQVSLEIKGNELYLKSGTGQVTVKLLPENEVIPMPPKLSGQEIMLEHEELAEILKTCAVAMSRDSNRGNVNGLAMRRNSEGLQFFGTDGHRVHVSQLSALVTPIDPEPESARDYGILIPVQSVECISKILHGNKSRLTFTFSRNGIQLDSEAITVRLPVSTERPPFIEHLLQKDFTSFKTKWKKTPLLKALRAVSPSSGDEAVRLFVGKEKMRVITHDSTSTAQRELECESSQDGQFTMEGKYIQQVLECASSENMEFELYPNRGFYHEGQNEFLVMFRVPKK